MFAFHLRRNGIHTYIIKYLLASLYLECDFLFVYLVGCDILSSESADPFKILYLVTISLAGVRQYVWVCISYGMWMGVVEEGDINNNNNTHLYYCCSKIKKNVPSEHLIPGSLRSDGNTYRTLNPKIIFFSFCMVWMQNGVAMGLVEEGCSVPLCRILNLHFVARRTGFRADTTHRSVPRLHVLMLSRQYTMGVCMQCTYFHAA